eukprot:scaffold4328_cov135-Isochrysis_galbana.AAC.18
MANGRPLGQVRADKASRVPWRTPTHVGHSSSSAATSATSIRQGKNTVGAHSYSLLRDSRKRWRCRQRCGTLECACA